MEGMEEKTTATKPAPNMRQAMPLTAEWVDEQRAKYGDAHVNACIRQAITGTPGLFYAMEAGHVLGTPFPSAHPIASEQNWAVMLGCKFAAFIAHPKGKP